jgi:hypothetical protein
LFCYELKDLVFELEEVDEAGDGENLADFVAQVTDVNVVTSGLGTLQNAEEDAETTG